MILLKKIFFIVQLECAFNRSLLKSPIISLIIELENSFETALLKVLSSSIT